MARSRFRSVRYDLTSAIEVARMADSAGGTIGPDMLAPALGYSGTNNGAYLSRVAGARLFGVVSGRGARLDVTERGRQILAGVEPGASVARRDAFLAVPLFRAVAEAAATTGGILPGDVAGWLVDEFGEVESKAQPVADQLIASAGQARLIRRLADGNIQLTNVLTDFTPVDNHASIIPIRPVGLRRGARSTPGEDVTMAEHGIWLDEEIDRGTRRPPAWRRAGVVASAAAVLVVVAIPVALVAGGSSPRQAAVHKVGKHPQVGNGPAEHQVLSALSATTDSGSFNFAYDISSTPASSTASTTTTTMCSQVKMIVPTGSNTGSGVVYMPNGVTTGGAVVQQPGTNSGSSAVSSFGGPATVSGAATAITVSGSNGGGVVTQPVAGQAVPIAVTPGSGSLPPGYKWKTMKECSGPVMQPSPDVKGSGTINTSPYGMIASANIGNGLDVSVRVSNSVVYEGSSSDTGLAPVTSDVSSTGTPLPGFASITESTLGNREGAVAMMGMASPTGYLDLVQPAIGAASQTGTGTVDGVPVTNYQVTNDLSQLAAAAGTSTAEAQTISDALTVLKAQDYTSNTAVVSIDGAGFIRQVKSVDTFADGGTVTLLATFTDFGCAGTILMPGQTGSGMPPSGCSSPDVANASTSTTTSSVPSPPTTVGSAGTTVPGSSSTTSDPGSSTTTPIASSPGTTGTSTSVPSSPSSSSP